MGSLTNELYCGSEIKLFSYKFLITRFLLNLANYTFLYGLYLLGAFGNAASKDAST